jgi:hypothetical protein
MSDSKFTDSKVAQLILKLQEDLKTLKEFQKDLDKVLTEAGIIDDEAKDALKNGDVFRIQKLLFEIESGSEKY